MQEHTRSTISFISTLHSIIRMVTALDEMPAVFIQAFARSKPPGPLHSGSDAANGG